MDLGAVLWGGPAEGLGGMDVFLPVRFVVLQE